MRILPLCALAAIIALGCSAGSDDASTEGTDPSAVTAVDSTAATAGAVTSVTTGMSVSGNHLLKDGEPFRPRGFNMIGVLTPAWCSNGGGVTARNHFGSAELQTAIDTWHATTVRFQVSQRGLGDSSLTATQISDYLTEVKNDVALANSLGLVVILSMQDQSIGCGNVHPLPSAQTVAAWRTLVPAFANSPYVVFELFNEPQNDTSDAQWQQWKSGGTSPLANLGDAAVGHQTLVNDIRGMGADNVLLADAARLGEHLDNVTNYLLADSGSGKGIAYAIHPYYYAPGSSYWQSSWGYLAPSHALIATEWNYKADDCGGKQQSLAPSFLAYLEQNGIGMTGHAFDAMNTLVADWSYTPTQCGTSVGGAGHDLLNWYGHMAQKPSAPTGLSTAGQSTSVTASWTASNGAFAVAGYELFVDGARTGTTTATSATLGGLTCNASHTIGVEAYDALGNHSGLTTATAHTAACTGLSVTSLTASPQPLVTSSTISFKLSANASVDLDIKNQAGTIVKHKWTGQALSAGTHSVGYYGYDDAGHKLASGTYVVFVKATDAGGATASAQTNLAIQ